MDQSALQTDPEGAALPQPGNTDGAGAALAASAAQEWRLLSLIRVALGVGATLFAALEAPPGFAQLATLLLAAGYAAYGVALFVRGARAGARPSCWIDLSWCVMLLLPSGGAFSPLISYLLFPALCAALRDGFVPALRVTLAAAAGMIAVQLLIAPPSGPLELLPLAWRPLALIALGHVIGRWGEARRRERNDLVLLGDIARLPNPRLGPEQLIAGCLERIREFYGAQSCLALMHDGGTGALLFLADLDAPHAPLIGQALSPELAGRLLDLPATGIAYEPPHPLAALPARLGFGVPPAADRRAQEVARWLDARNFISVVLGHPEEPIGRLYVTGRRQAFARADLALLAQLAARVAPMIENVQVLDRMATDATRHERERISRDLHDGTIQPYLGLKFGLEALRRRVPDDATIAPDLDDLIRMTGEGISELRRYVGGLRDAEPPLHASLPEALEQLVVRYRDQYGIAVDMQVDPALRLSDRLAAEVLQIVNEGLSNVRRHTASRHARLHLRRQAGELIVQLINDGGGAQAPFRPRSISDRVAHLGGRLEVGRIGDGGTCVTAEIPL